MEQKRIFFYLFKFLTMLLILVLFLFPLLKNGVVFALDNVASPLQQYSFFTISINGMIYQKLYLFLIYTVGLGVIFFGIKFNRIYISIILSLFLVVNPFWQGRLAVGQFDLLFGTVLVFWSITNIYNIFNQKNIHFNLVSLIITVLLSLKFYPRSVSFYEIILFASLFAISSIFWKRCKNKIERLLVSTITILTVLAVIIFFKIIILKVINDWHFAVTSDQISLFAIGSGGFTRRIIGAAAYIGFWAETANRTIVDFTQEIFWTILGITLLSPTIKGWYLIIKKNATCGIFIVALYFLSFVVVASNTNLIPSQVLWRIYNEVGLIDLRETGKFMALMLPAQIYGLAYYLDHKGSNMKKIIVAGLIIIYLPSATYNAYHALKPAQYPTHLISTAQSLNKSGKRVITFPWHRFQSYQFTNAKLVDQLGPVLFDNYIYNEMIEFNNLQVSSADPWQYKMAEVTSTNKIDHEFIGKLLKFRHVDAVVIFKTIDYQKYLDWVKAEKFKLIIDDTAFAVYSLD